MESKAIDLACILVTQLDKDDEGRKRSVPGKAIGALCTLLPMKELAMMYFIKPRVCFVEHSMVGWDGISQKARAEVSLLLPMPLPQVPAIFIWGHGKGS